MIRALYAIERQLREAGASEATILARRRDESTPIVDQFFAWVTEQIADPALLPRSPLARALGYAREREPGLRHFLTDAWLALDTNDLERALRVIPMGRRNWLFCTTEFGAQQVATIQTLLAAPPAGRMASTPTPTSSMCCSGSTGIRPAASLN